MYYIGIEELTANAFIELLKHNSISDLSISLKDLEGYGTRVADYINSKQKETAVLMLSKVSIEYMFNNYSNFFKAVTTNKGEKVAVKLQEGITIEDLIHKFRTNIAADFIEAYEDKSAIEMIHVNHPSLK